MYATRNFYIKYKDTKDNEDVSIGVWHILPDNAVRRFSKNLSFDYDLLKKTPALYDDDPLDETVGQNIVDGRDIYEEILSKVPGTIILYLHGNSGSRAIDHRVALYKIFQQLNCHVIAFDYRGYADSSDITPSEEGSVRDAIAVYKYIAKLTNSPIFIWGHSLGTAIGTHLLCDLNSLDNIPKPKGIFLEAPFNNMLDEVRSHTLSQIFKITPWFEYMFVRPMEANGFSFKSDEYILNIHQPISILHAEDDLIVPFKLGYKLFKTGIDMRNKSYGPIEFHRFEKSSHYGHKYIWKVPNLKDIIHDFIERYRNEMY